MPNYKQQLTNTYQMVRGVGLALCCTSMLAFILALSQPMMVWVALPCLTVGAIVALVSGLKLHSIFNVSNNGKKTAGVLLIILPVIYVLLLILMYALSVISFEEGRGLSTVGSSKECTSAIECIDAGTAVADGGGGVDIPSAAVVIGVIGNIVALLANPLVYIGSWLLVSIGDKGIGEKKATQAEVHDVEKEKL